MKKKTTQPSKLELKKTTITALSISELQQINGAGVTKNTTKNTSGGQDCTSLTTGPMLNDTTIIDGPVDLIDVLW